MSSTASEFARTLLAPKIAEEIQTVYQRAKKTLNLRRRDTSTESSEGEGNLDTPIFRYVVFGRQDPSEAANYQIVRGLELRNGAENQQEELDVIFGAKFQRIVIDIDSSTLNFDDLVDAFEDIEHAHGGTLIDDEGTSLISYTTPDGKILEIDLENGRVSLGSSRLRRCSELLESVRQYRFSVSGPTRLISG
ncbi:MAG: hypothetical protein WAM17_04095 [Rhodoplanes sp.]